MVAPRGRTTLDFVGCRPNLLELLVDCSRSWCTFYNGFVPFELISKEESSHGGGDCNHLHFANIIIIFRLASVEKIQKEIAAWNIHWKVHKHQHEHPHQHQHQLKRYKKDAKQIM